MIAFGPPYEVARHPKQPNGWGPDVFAFAWAMPTSGMRAALLNLPFKLAMDLRSYGLGLLYGSCSLRNPQPHPLESSWP
ncbi:hypothetical protein PMIT1313_02421 [Prochlorococcus marinus str. MIT 1313]|uniref:hypothetical protein n=2 Tax=Prochlorococcus TaxID=1218 RepID=UPI0007B3A23B|nr:hypothetical protein [Prochlorococcus marinus]KZR68797.1 hypothetical protein PMIT1313_02421 [Prochlorococcus marinus str. MIT 1313]